MSDIFNDPTPPTREEVSQELHDAVFEGGTVLRHHLRDLSHIADAFGVTGNRKMDEALTSIAKDIDRLWTTMRDAYCRKSHYDAFPEKLRR